jgi:hypothetical protein
MRLLLVGGVRNEADAARVEELKELADSLQVSVCSRSSRFHPVIYDADHANGAGIRRFCGERIISPRFGAPQRG